MLDQLHQDAPGTPGVQEGDEVPAGAGTGCGVDEFDALGRESVQVRLQVPGTVCDVVEGLSSALQEPPDGGGGAKGLQEFDLAAEGHPDALGLQNLGRGTRLAGYEFEQTRGVFDGRNGDGHVVQRAIAWCERIHDGSAR